MPAATISSPAPPSSGRSSSSSSDIACDLASVCVDVIKLFAPDIHQADDTVKFHQVDEKRARGTELSSCSRRFKRKVLTILYCKFSYLFFYSCVAYAVAVCLPVCPSQVGVLSKRLNVAYVASCKQSHTIVYWVFWYKRCCHFLLFLSPLSL